MFLMYAVVKKPTTVTDTVRLNRLCWFGHVQRMEGNIILPPKKRIIYEFENNKAER